jgi:hypothetical protein
VLKVKTWKRNKSKPTTVFKKKLDGLSVKGDSKIILFEEDEVFVSKGFECSLQLQITEAGCWYRELAQPCSDKFVSGGGFGRQMVRGTNLFFHVHIPAADTIPHVCPISRIFFRPRVSSAVV